MNEYIPYIQIGKEPHYESGIKLYIYLIYKNKYMASNDGNTLVQNNNKLTELNTNTNSLNTNLNGIVSQTDALFTHQASMNSILQEEQARLLQKKDSVENAYTSQKRAVYLNDNLQKRYAAYSKILIISVITLSIVFVLALIQRFVPVIPSIVFNILYLVLFTGSFIWCMLLFFEIQTHDKMDYDKIALKSMTATGGTDSSGTDVSNNDVSGNCMNEACCDPDTQIYDPELNKCKNKAQGFSCMGNGIQSYDSYEFTNYSKY
jgi:hypothetical protein